MPEPLAPAAGDEGVDGLDPEGQLAVDQFAPQRVGRGRFDARPPPTPTRGGRRRWVGPGRRGPDRGGRRRRSTGRGDRGPRRCRRSGRRPGRPGACRPGRRPATATTSASRTPPPRQIRTASPTAAATPSTSMRSPTRRVTRPVRRGATAACSDACRGWGIDASRRRPACPGPTRSMRARARSMAGPDLGVDPARSGLDHAAAQLDLGIVHDLDRSVGHQSLEFLGRDDVTRDGGGRRGPRPAAPGPRPASPRRCSSDGLRLDLAAEQRLGQLEGQFDRFVSRRRDHGLGPLRAGRGGGGDERLGQAAQLRGRDGRFVAGGGVGQAGGEALL